jgi:hypothetical protein
MVRPASTVAAALGLAGCLAIGIIAACVPDVGTTNYGDPNGLRRDTLPGEGGTEAVACDGGGGGGGEGGGPCAVSFAKDIYPNMVANGAWKCASTGTCHGAQQTPLIDASTPAAVIDSLKDYMISGDPHPYIAQGKTDPNASAFECNVTGVCGSAMPQSPGVPLSPAEVCKIDAWLRCGAPSN